MKNLLLILLIPSIYSCGGGSPVQVQQSAADSARYADSVRNISINDFKEFRNAVYTGDINKAKAYFKFPVMDDQNGIWDLVPGDGERVNRVNDKDEIIIVPFTEKDFTVHFKNLFPKEFITSILKIKSEELFRTGNSETQYFEKDSVTDYRMIASFSKKDTMLILNVFYRFNLKDENGEPQEDGTESSMVYEFFVKSDGHLVFRHVFFAG